MPRERDPKRAEAEKLYLDSAGKIDLVEIASRLGISDGTVRGWKSKDKWERKLDGTFQTNERNVPKNTERSKIKQERNEQSAEPKIESQELTEKQRIFVVEYLRDFNATRAAMAVGYSKRSAYSEGWRLLRNAEVQAELDRHKETYMAELGLDVKRVIAELMKIGFADISDVMEFGQKDIPVFDENGTVIINRNTGEPYTMKESFVSLKNAENIDSTVINEVKKTKEGVSVKLYDKMRALEKLERYLPYMTDEEKLRLDKLRAEIKSAQMKGF